MESVWECEGGVEGEVGREGGSVILNFEAEGGTVG